MTPEQEWKHLVWRRWMRIKRRHSTAHISGDIIVRANEQKTMADAIDTFDRQIHKPKLIQSLLK